MHASLLYPQSVFAQGTGAEEVIVYVVDLCTIQDRRLKSRRLRRRVGGVHFATAGWTNQQKHLSFSKEELFYSLLCEHVDLQVPVAVSTSGCLIYRQAIPRLRAVERTRVGS